MVLHFTDKTAPLKKIDVTDRRGLEVQLQDVSQLQPHLIGCCSVATDSVRRRGDNLTYATR